MNELASLPIVTSVYVKKADKGGPTILVPGEMEVGGWQDQGHGGQLTKSLSQHKNRKRTSELSWCGYADMVQQLRTFVPLSRHTWCPYIPAGQTHIYIKFNK